jgi:uncharacterized OsmC-like protein
MFQTVDKPAAMNGVSVTGIVDTISAVQADPGLAEFRFNAANEWLGGSHNRSTILPLYGCREMQPARTEPWTYDNGEPQILLGRDEGANPVEFLLHALIGCITTTMAYHAAARGIEIAAIDSTIEGDVDLRGLLRIADVRPGYREIRVKMRVKTEGAAKKLAELLSFSPVYDVVSKSVPVKVTVETY